MSSYEEILSRMVQKYEALAGFTVSEESDIMIRMKVLAGEIYNNTVASRFLKRQMFVLTASGDYLDKHALTRGLQRKSDVKATGEVMFCRSVVADSDVIIEKGTVVSTCGPQILQFITDETAVIEAGTSCVTVSATAIEGGSKYNVIKGAVSVMVTPPVGVTSVENTKAFTGGSDKETDDELRERVLYSYRDISNGTNAVYYKRLAESVEGVYSASVVSKVRGAGTLNVYICGKGSAAVNKDHIATVQQILDENRELNVDIEVLYAKALNVNFNLNLSVSDGYSFEDVSSEVTDKITEYIDSLGVGNPTLLCELSEIIYHTQGVKNFEFLDAYCNDIYPADNEYCVLSTLDIGQV